MADNRFSCTLAINIFSQNMSENKYYSQKINVFHGRQAPEKGTLVGYGAIIEIFNYLFHFLQNWH